MADGGEEESAHVRQLRAALHYTVGHICDEVAAERGVPFDRAAVATLTELTMGQTAVLARDLELFAQHARRTLVGPDDVKLLVRRSPTLLAEVQCEARRLATAAGAEKERRRVQRSRKAAARQPAAEAVQPAEPVEVMELE